MYVPLLPIRNNPASANLLHEHLRCNKSRAKIVLSALNWNRPDTTSGRENAEGVRKGKSQRSLGNVLLGVWTEYGIEMIEPLRALLQVRLGVVSKIGWELAFEKYSHGSL